MKHSKFYDKSSQQLATNWVLENSQDRDGCLRNTTWESDMSQRVVEWTLQVLLFSETSN
jgi:hypothetical protein